MCRALVGDFTETDKSDASSRYHKRWYSADLYDLKNNKSLGRQQVYFFNVRYRVSKARWYVDLDIYQVLEIRAR